MPYETYIDKNNVTHKISTSPDIYKVTLYLTPQQWDRLSKWSLTQPICPDDPEESAWLGLDHYTNCRDDFLDHVKSIANSDISQACLQDA